MTPNKLQKLWCLIFLLYRNLFKVFDTSLNFYGLINLHFQKYFLVGRGKIIQIQLWLNIPIYI